MRTATTPQGQGHRTVIAQVVADRLGVEPTDVDVLTEVDTSTSPWTIASGNYSSRFSGVGVGAVAARGRAARGEDRRDPRAPRRRERVAPPRRRHGALEPRGAPGRDGAGARGDGVLRGAEPPPAGRRRSGRVVRRARFRRRRRRRRDRSRHRRGHGSRLRDGPRRGATSEPAPRRRTGSRRASPTERPQHSSSVTSTTRTATSSPARSWTTSCRPRPTCPTPRIGHRESPSPFLPLGAKGLGEGTTMSVPAAIANAVADALGRDDVEPPFTPGRVWELLRR